MTQDEELRVVDAIEKLATLVDKLATLVDKRATLVDKLSGHILTLAQRQRDLEERLSRVERSVPRRG